MHGIMHNLALYRQGGIMIKQSRYVSLFYCFINALIGLLAGISMSCEAILAGLYGGAGGSRTIGDVTDFSDILATYRNVGNDCMTTEKYTPKNTTELKRLIQRDIQEQGSTVNLNYINTSAITDMSDLFTTKEGATFNGAIHCWDVGSVVDMSAMFKGASRFNQNINSWDVGSVVDMSAMFKGASRFNQNINGWDVRKVVNMSEMFSNATNFDQDLDEWKMARNTQNMRAMFKGAKAFNGNIEGWQVAEVITMEAMFENATKFNQDLNDWDVSNVQTMRAMFKGAASFNRKIIDWDVGSVDTMEGMFQDASRFNQDLSGWSDDVKPLVNTRAMFTKSKLTEVPDWKNAGVCFDPTSHGNVVADKEELMEKIDTLITTSELSPNLNHIEVCNVTDMSGLFRNKATFNGDITQWDVSRVKNMKDMFSGASAFNQDISAWDVRQVTTMSGMFSGASAFNQDISAWDVRQVTTMSGMFQNANRFTQDLTSWNTKVQATVDTGYIFASSGLSTIPDWRSAGICFAPTAHGDVVENKADLQTKISELITPSTPSPNLNHLETCNVTDMSGLFRNKATFNGDITQWDVSNVTGMSDMFWGAKAFNQDIGDWNVSNVTHMGYMFRDTHVFNQDIADWNVSKVKEMQYMFNNAPNFCNGGMSLEAWNGKMLETVNTTGMFDSTEGEAAPDACTHIPPSWY